MMRSEFAVSSLHWELCSEGINGALLMRQFHVKLLCFIFCSERQIKKKGKRRRGVCQFFSPLLGMNTKIQRRNKYTQYSGQIHGATPDGSVSRVVLFLFSIHEGRVKWGKHVGSPISIVTFSLLPPVFVYKIWLAYEVSKQSKETNRGKR